jgi:hypothetical protein
MAPLQVETPAEGAFGSLPDHLDSTGAPCDGNHISRLTEGGTTMNITVRDATAREAGGMVRLVYHYRDGHDFTTETMLRSQAVAYMPLLHALPVDPEHYRAAFAEIELRSA